MFSSIFDSTAIPALEQVVNFSQARHQVLAGNIANMDTPGYRTRDLSPDEFQAKLKEALQTRDPHESLDSVFGPRESRQAAIAKVSDSMNSILYHDDSNDSIEHQVAEISKNQMQHNMALAIMSSQFGLLQTAISERV